jgi:hypothetical protein
LRSRKQLSGANIVLALLSPAIIASLGRPLCSTLLAGLLLLLPDLLELAYTLADGSIEVRVVTSGGLEKIGLGLVHSASDPLVSDGVDHGLPDLVVTAVGVAVRVVNGDHLVGSSELVAEEAVEVAFDSGLGRLDLHAVDGAVEIDGLLDVAGLGGDLEGFAGLEGLDLVQDVAKAFDGRAAEGDLVDDLVRACGDQVADLGAMLLDEITIDDADESLVAG